MIVTSVCGINGPEPRKFFRLDDYNTISNPIGGWYYSPCGSIRSSQVVNIHPEDIYLKPFLSRETINVPDYISLALLYGTNYSIRVHPIFKGYVSQIEVNHMNTIVRVTTNNGEELGIRSWDDNTYFSAGTRDYTEYGSYIRWPEMSDIVTKCEYRWKTLTDKLINACRLRHKMRPDGTFMKQLIARDADFN